MKITALDTAVKVSSLLTGRPTLASAECGCTRLERPPILPTWLQVKSLTCPLKPQGDLHILMDSKWNTLILSQRGRKLKSTQFSTNPINQGTQKWLWWMTQI